MVFFLLSIFYIISGSYIAVMIFGAQMFIRDLRQARQQRRLARQNLQNLAQGLMNEDQINQNQELRRFFEEGLNSNEINMLPSSKMKLEQYQGHQECTICLSNINVSLQTQEDEIILTLPNCKHFFHKNCVITWLKTKAYCPLCRNNIRFYLSRNNYEAQDVNVQEN